MDAKVIYSLLIFIVYQAGASAQKAQALPVDRLQIEPQYFQPLILNLSSDYIANSQSKMKLADRYLDMYKGTYRYEVGMLASSMKLKYSYMIRSYRNLTLTMVANFEDEHKFPRVEDYLEALGSMLSAYNQIVLTRASFYEFLRKHKESTTTKKLLRQKTETNYPTRTEKPWADIQKLHNKNRDKHHEKHHGKHQTTNSRQTTKRRNNMNNGPRQWRESNLQKSLHRKHLKDVIETEGVKIEDIDAL